MKRVFDMVVSFTALLMVSPVMVVVSLMIKLETKGPVVFKQERVGRYGQPFVIYKFRSMVDGAASKGPYFTRGKDSRITKVGRFVRKTSLDELPQLINVLKGDMSLVGPRPNLFLQSVEYTDSEWVKRNSVRPGITGLAQARLRSAATPEDRTKFDLEYVDKVSFLFDVWVILLTVHQMFLKRGGN